jgi:phenylalanyl-tRNA synthetase alpha chain
VSALDRIAELRDQGEAAIAQAGTAADLETIRVTHLGRKAELPNLLRTVAQLPPEERSAVGRSANEARKALEAALEARAGELEASELDARLIADRVDVTLPGAPVRPAGRLHVLTATRREIEDVFLGLGFTVARVPRSSSSTTTSTRSTTTRRTPRAACRTPSTSRRTPSCAPTRRPCRCGRWSSGRRPSP